MRINQICLPLPIDMKNLLKYLVLVFATALFWNCADKSLSSVPGEGIPDMAAIEGTVHTSISETDSELCLPRQISFANSYRAQSTVRRTNTAHRNNIEFAKAGKIVNPGLRYAIQTQSIIIHSSLMEPSHRLLCLGRLII